VTDRLTSPSEDPVVSDRAALYLPAAGKHKISPYANVWQGSTTVGSAAGQGARWAPSMYAPLEWVAVVPIRGRNSASRSITWLALAVVLVSSATLAAIMYLSGTSTVAADTTKVTHTVTVPGTFGDYTLTTSTSFAQQIHQPATETGLDNPLKTALVGAYITPGSAAPDLFYVGIKLSSSPAITAAVKSSGAEAAVRTLLQGTGATSSADFPAGSLGGVLRCGADPVTSQVMCMWLDSSTAGIVILSGNPSLPSAATTAVAFRAIAEH
jgi:hypothetical protein